MAKVMDHPVPEPSSDSEEINKLFPRCRPRTTSDVNRNTIVKERKLASPFGSNSTVNSMDKANDNYMRGGAEEDDQDEANRRPPLSPAAPSDASETSSCCDQQRDEARSSNQNNMLVTEDRSVISAYEYCDYDGSLLCNSKDGHTPPPPPPPPPACADRQEYSEDVSYEPELDVGYQLEANAAYCLRESRIEIAGGREIFSKSRSKPAKKRHGDDVAYHRQRVYDPSAQKDDYKRYSADVMYDEKLSRYAYACSGSVDRLHACSKFRTEMHIEEEDEEDEDEASPSRDHRMNGRSSLKKSASVKGLQDFSIDTKQRPFSSSHLVYEAPVRNAEIVYDDIGELIDQQRGDVADGNDVSAQGKAAVSDRVPGFSGYRGEILESPNSDTDGAFQFGNKPQVGTLDSNSPVSPCSRTWNTGTALQENENAANFSQEDMDTDSEPPSPYRDGIARVIGNVPIAEYEGSPRRYGPRPGYPQRVVSESDPKEEKAHPTTCEELLKVIAGESSVRQNCSKGSDACESSQKEDASPCDGLADSVTRVDDTKQAEDLIPEDKVPGNDSKAQESDFSELEYRLYRVNTGSSYVGRRLAQQASASGNQESPKRSDAKMVNGDIPRARSEQASPVKPSDGSPAFLPNEQELMLLHESVHQHTLQVEMVEQDLESISTYPGTEDLGETEVGEQVDHTRNFTLSPETTDCDSNDVESVVSLEGSMNSAGRLMSSMPVLEDGLSSGHSSDRDEVDPESSDDEDEDRSDGQVGKAEQDYCKRPSNGLQPVDKLNHHDVAEYMWRHSCNSTTSQRHELQDVDLSYFDVLAPKPDETSQRLLNNENSEEVVVVDECRSNAKQDPSSVSEAIKEIKQAIQMSKNVQLKSTHSGKFDGPNQPVWVPRLSSAGKPKDSCHGDTPAERNVDEDDCDTDQETDRLLGAQRTDDKGFYDDKGRNASNKKKSTSKEVLIHEPAVLIEGVLFRARYLGSTQLVCEGQPTKATRMMQAEEAVSRIKHNPARQFKSDVTAARGTDEGYATGRGYDTEDQLKISLCPHAAPEGETQPSTEVDLFISTEKIMVLNTDLKVARHVKSAIHSEQAVPDPDFGQYPGLISDASSNTYRSRSHPKEIMMDHALRAISYIADIGDLVVLMARRRVMNSPDDPNEPKIKRTPKMICHVFESEEAQFIAQSIGQAFQVAYMEFLKANGIEDSSFVKEMDYQEVLNSQEIFGNELEMFAKKEKQKEVVVPKQKGEILGMVIVESGWGSMLPTVVIANMAQSGPAARCGQLNIGDQIIAINGISLVGLPLSTCQNYIKNTKNQTVVKLTVVPCAPVVEVKIKRPDTKYQLGFSVQNGVICSLLRGGIAERGGVRVGHRIIEINGQSVVAVPHEKIVNLLATSVGEIHMKTMPTSMFRLLTGQESPLYI